MNALALSFFMSTKTYSIIMCIGEPKGREKYEKEGREGREKDKEEKDKKVGEGKGAR